MKLNWQKLEGWATVWWKFHHPIWQTDRQTDRRTGDSI